MFIIIEHTINPDKQADLQENAGASLTEDEKAEQEGPRVWENITSDLDGYEYIGTMTLKEYTSFLQEKGFRFIDEGGEFSTEPAWMIVNDSICARPIFDGTICYGLDSDISFWTHGDSDIISAISYTFRLEDGYENEYSYAIETMKRVTPLPCGIQVDDSFGVICEKVGITQEMLKEDENGFANFLR